MSTSRAILITRPNHDLINTYFFYWSELVIKVAEKHKIQVFDLKGDKANNEIFTSYMKKHEPMLVFLNGHGNDNMIAGQNNDILIRANDNETLLANKIVYARSCDAGSHIGQLCILNKTLSFIGYKRKYALVFDILKETKPLHDNVARLFLEPSNLVPISLLKGNTVEKAYQKSQNAMLRNFYYMLSTRASQLERDAAPYLWANRKFQVVLGDATATFK